MSDAPNAEPDKKMLLGCQLIVYRALLKKGWIDKTCDPVKIMPAAFFRRPRPQDQDGISVAHSCDVVEYLGGFKSAFGAASLHVGRIRDIGIDVIPDEPGHAAIPGVPYQEDDILLAESLASDLAAQSRPFLIL